MNVLLYRASQKCIFKAVRLASLGNMIIFKEIILPVPLWPMWCRYKYMQTKHLKAAVLATISLKVQIYTNQDGSSLTPPLSSPKQVIITPMYIRSNDDPVTKFLQSIWNFFQINQHNLLTILKPPNQIIMITTEKKLIWSLTTSGFMI